VALRLPPQVVTAVAALPRPELPRVRWTEPERWIVKVRPLGHVAAHVVDGVAEALTAELDGAPPVSCTIGPVTERLGGDWLSVPVRGLDELGEAVFAATEGLVPVTHPQPFRPFLVLATGRVPKELGGLPLEAAFTVDSVALVADRSAPGRPHLVDVATFPLTAP
jgi:hypothetical protein